MKFIKKEKYQIVEKQIQIVKLIQMINNQYILLMKQGIYITTEIKQLIEFPNGLTSIIQSLDISINFSFKNPVRNKYINHIMNNSNDRNHIIISKIEVINLINEVWYDYNIITKKMIFKSFKETGISINLNGSDKSLNTSY